MHKDNGKKYTITTYREKAPSYRLPLSLLFGMPPIPIHLDPPHKPLKYIYLQGTSPSAHIGRSETKRKGTITSLPSPSSLMEIKKESPKRQKPATAISEPQPLRFSRRKTRICARDFFRFGSTFFLFSRQNEKFYARHFQGHETSFFSAPLRIFISTTIRSPANHPTTDFVSFIYSRQRLQSGTMQESGMHTLQ